MSVGELIETLKGLDPSERVYCYDAESQSILEANCVGPYSEDGIMLLCAGADEIPFPPQEYI